MFVINHQWKNVRLFQFMKGMQGDGKPSFTTRKILIDSQQQI